MVSCGSPLTPMNGLVHYISTTYQSIADYTCNAGYQLSGAATVTCEANAQWSSPPPLCDSELSILVYVCHCHHWITCTVTN